MAKYDIVNLSDLNFVNLGTGKKPNFELSTKGDEDTVPLTERFWQSFNSTHGVSKDTYKVFEPNEVVERLIQKRGDRQIRLTTDISNTHPSGEVHCAISNPEHGVLEQHRVMEIIESLGGKLAEDQFPVLHRSGVATIIMDPVRFGGDLVVAGDDFTKKFIAEIPYDGFGDPKFSIGMIRQICTNGAVGMGATFTTRANLGQADDYYTLQKGLKTFSNEKGFSHMISAFEKSRNCYASALEIMKMLDFLAPAERATFAHLYKDAFQHALSEHTAEKRKRRIETNITGYDLLNMLTEISTHTAEENAKGALGAMSYASKLLTDGFDCEGLHSKIISQPKAFYLLADKVA